MTSDLFEFIECRINPTEPTEENIKQYPNRKQFVAEHKTKPNLFVTYNPDLGFNFNALYRMKPVAKDAHLVLFELLNKLNLGDIHGCIHDKRHL